MGSTGATGSIFLAGPPFSGKTETGRLLASITGLPFADLDSAIEKRASMTVPGIFEELGEEAFRELESDTLAETVTSRGELVLSLGGGCLLRERNLRFLEGRGAVVTLTAGTDELVARMRARPGGRPLALTETALRELLKRRGEHYASLPNRIDTTGLTPEETAKRILEYLEKSLS